MPLFLFFVCGAPKATATTVSLLFFSFCLLCTKESNGNYRCLLCLCFGYNTQKKATTTVVAFYFCFLLQAHQRRWWQQCCHRLFFVFWLQCTKEGDGNCRYLLFLFFAYGAPKKAMTVMLSLPSFFFFWLQRTKKGDGNCHRLLFCFWVATMHQRRRR